MFSADYDDRRQRVHIIRIGFFDIGDVDRLHADVRTALRRAACTGLAFDILIDNSAGQPLASDVAARFEQIAADMRASKARRIAYISPGALNRIQARRIAHADTEPRIRLFTDAADAEGWIAERP